VEKCTAPDLTEVRGLRAAGVSVTTSRDVRAHPTWTKAQAYWAGEQRRRTLHCARCGQAIVRGGPRGPWSLDVGHIVSAAQALDNGWSIAQANALTNTQPEHAKCNRLAGAHHGASRRWGRQSIVTMSPVTSGTWG
jgi:hypothetical protein